MAAGSLMTGTGGCWMSMLTSTSMIRSLIQKSINLEMSKTVCILFRMSQLWRSISRKSISCINRTLSKAIKRQLFIIHLSIISKPSLKSRVPKHSDSISMLKFHRRSQTLTNWSNPSSAYSLALILLAANLAKKRLLTQ